MSIAFRKAVSLEPWSAEMRHTFRNSPMQSSGVCQPAIPKEQTRSFQSQSSGLRPCNQTIKCFFASCTATLSLAWLAGSVYQRLQVPSINVLHHMPDGCACLPIEDQQMRCSCGLTFDGVSAGHGIIVTVVSHLYRVQTPNKQWLD